MVARAGTFPAAGGQASASQIPWGWLGYAQVVAGQGSITTEVDLTGLSVAVNVGTNRRIRVSFQTISVSSTVVTDTVQPRIYEDATLKSRTNVSVVTASGSFAHLAVILTPSAGAHTYKVTCLRAVGTGTVTVGAASDAPAFILVEDIGPAT